MGIYCDKTKDEQANDVELQNCAALNERIGIPLSDIELNRAAKNANLDINALNSCIKSESKQLVADSNALSASFQLGISPIAIVDCKYIVNILNAASSVCDIHPDVEGCSALVPVSDINAEE
jgi:hypothetical protein